VRQVPPSFGEIYPQKPREAVSRRPEMHWLPPVSDGSRARFCLSGLVLIRLSADTGGYGSGGGA
jgi:hypothetical protein